MYSIKEMFRRIIEAPQLKDIEVEYPITFQDLTKLISGPEFMSWSTIRNKISMLLNVGFLTMKGDVISKDSVFIVKIWKIRRSLGIEYSIWAEEQENKEKIEKEGIHADGRE